MNTQVTTLRERLTSQYSNFKVLINICLIFHTLQAIEIKGQMVYLEESNSILFLGSPKVGNLDDLTSKGLFLADIPIHDATRDLILVGEESRAQDTMKKQMDALKSQIEEASGALEEEKKRNVELLNMIFPADIAQKLWLGEPVEASTTESVSMLFSDIVGFTAICSSCTPFMVISMLNTLYTKFDTYCNTLDLYKVCRN